MPPLHPSPTPGRTRAPRGGWHPIIMRRVLHWTAGHWPLGAFPLHPACRRRRCLQRVGETQRSTDAAKCRERSCALNSGETKGATPKSSPGPGRSHKTAGEAAPNHREGGCSTGRHAIGCHPLPPPAKRGRNATFHRRRERPRAQLCFKPKRKRRVPPLILRQTQAGRARRAEGGTQSS